MIGGGPRQDKQRVRRAQPEEVRHAARRRVVVAVGPSLALPLPLMDGRGGGGSGDARGVLFGDEIGPEVEVVLLP